MRKLQALRTFVYLPLWVLLSYIIGILTTPYLPFLLPLWAVVVFVGVLFCYGIACYFFFTAYKTPFFIMLLLFFALMGILQTQHRQELSMDFFSKVQNKNNQLYVLVAEKPTGKKYLIARVAYLNDAPVKAKVLLGNPAILKQCSVGQWLLITGTVRPFKTPKQPYQFDAKAYFFNKGVFASCYARSFVLGKKEPHRLMVWRAKLVSAIKRNFDKTAFSNNTKSLIYALVLGDRSGFSKAQRADYARAGVAHIFAISGLHIGILLFFFKWLFSFWLRLKKGRYFQYLSILIMLWWYAWLVGATPSVVRAVLLFSFFLLGMFIGRSKAIFQQLVLAALVVLVLNPYQIYHVGFQMSYAAVLAIIWLQPKLASYHQPKNKTLNYVWSLLTVSVAAQIGVLPLSIYYFHQFSFLFLLGNLTLLPIVPLLVISGMFLMMVAFIGASMHWLQSYYDGFVNLISLWIRWLSEQDSWIVTDIYWSWDTLLLKMLFIYSVCCFVAYRRLFFLQWAVCGAILVNLIGIFKVFFS